MDSIDTLRTQRAAANAAYWAAQDRLDTLDGASRAAASAYWAANTDAMLAGDPPALAVASAAQDRWHALSREEAAVRGQQRSVAEEMGRLDRQIAAVLNPDGPRDGMGGWVGRLPGAAQLAYSATC